MLLATPLTRRHDGTVYKGLRPVLDHPAVQQLNSDDLEQLLLIALAKGDIGDVLLLCYEPAAADISPAAAGRLLAAAVQLSGSAYRNAVICTLPRFDAVSMDDVLPAVRAAMCGSSGPCTSIVPLRAIAKRLHAKQPELAVSQVLPEALRMAVLLQNLYALQRVWEISTDLGRSVEADQEQVTAVAACAILGGYAAAIQHLLGLASPLKQVQVWQQLLAMALIAREAAAALPLAGECFHRHQLHEPWLPALMQLAVSAGRTGHAELHPGVTVVNAAVGCTGQGLSEQQQQPRTQHKQGLQQLFNSWQLQGQEQEMFSEDCLQQVVQVMAAATRGSTGSFFSSSWDAAADTAGSTTPVAALALQLLRSKRDPGAVQLLQTSLQHMVVAAAAAGSGTTQHTAAVAVVAELLQTAVAASNAGACSVLCCCSLSQHLSQQQVMHQLMLAVQLLHFSTPWQRQQRWLVMRCMCKLFSDRTIAAVRADTGSSSSMATRACVRQVLACAVQIGCEEALQQLLAIIPVQEQPLLSHTDMFVLQATALRQARLNPNVMQMLCAVRLSWHVLDDPALQPMSANRLFDLLKQAVQLGSCQRGVSEVVQTLIAWQPHPLPNKAGDPGLASRLDEGALLDLVECAKEITDVSERASVLRQLGDLGGPELKRSVTWSEVSHMLVPEQLDDEAE
jgi:hypothetical protein